MSREQWRGSVVQRRPSGRGKRPSDGRVGVTSQCKDRVNGELSCSRQTTSGQVPRLSSVNDGRVHPTSIVIVKSAAETLDRRTRL